MLINTLCGRLSLNHQFCAPPQNHLNPEELEYQVKMLYPDNNVI